MASSGKARVQHPAPHFQCTAVVNGAFEGKCFLRSIFHHLCSRTDPLPPEISLASYKNRWLVLAFVPMAWTFVCPTEIIAFSDAASQFTSRDTSVVFASTDSEYSLLAWASTPRKSGGLGGVNVPLLSDKNHKLSRDYGVLIEDEGIALRGLFLIDPKGLIRQVSETVVSKDRGSERKHPGHFNVESTEIGDHRMPQTSPKRPLRPSHIISPIVTTLLR
jgi:peroxiredoxin 2/4